MTETSEESANEDTRLVETTVDGHVAIAGPLSNVADPIEITNSIAKGSPAAVAATRTAPAFMDLRDGS